MDLPNWVYWGGTRTIIATAIGFLIAISVELLAEAFANRRRRRFMREALAEEVAFDLAVLDAYLDAPQPEQRLLTRIMERCVDPETGSLLSTREWLHATTAIQQCEAINTALDEPRNRLEAADLRSLGATLIELLCQIMKRQVRYNSHKMMRIAIALEPAWTHDFKVDRVWRTSLLANLAQRSGPLIAWKHDDPARTPESLTVIEIDPGFGGDRVRAETDGVLHRVTAGWRRRTALNGIAEQRAYLSAMKQMDE